MTLREIAALPDNWNFSKTSAFSAHHIELAEQFLAMCPTPPAMFPTARDSVQFEYEKESGDYLEFELFEDGNIKMFLYCNDTPTTKNPLPLSDVPQVIGEFIKKE